MRFKLCMVDKQNPFFTTLKRYAFNFLLFQRPLENLVANNGGAGGNHEVEGKIRKLGDRYALSDFSVTLTKRQRSIREKLMAIYSTAGIETPITEHVMEGFPSNERPEAKQVLDSLLTSGELVMLTPQICLYRKDYDRILEAVKTHFETNDSLTLAQLRDMLNTSRKYAQALVEYFDKIHITKKDGDIHYLDQGF